MKKQFLNLTIKELLQNISDQLIEIIQELIILFNNFKEVNNKENNWINLFVYYVKKIFFIFFKNDRLIAISFILFLTSIFFYFIKISDTNNK